MTAQEFAQRWGLRDLEVTPTHEPVFFARQGDDYVVLKIGDPEARAREARALMSFTGTRHARVIEYDDVAGAILVERILPGDDIVPLARVDDDEATALIGALIMDLHRDQVDHSGLPSLRQIGSAFALPCDARLPDDLRTRAAAVFAELMADDFHDVVLHGDLHHFNVLRSADGTWCAIDPHGWVGDPVFDTAAMLANPRGLVEEGDARGMDASDLVRLWSRRSQILADVTGFDLARIRAWSLVACVIAELWMLESHAMIHGAPLALAQRIAESGQG